MLNILNILNMFSLKMLNMFNFLIVNMLIFLKNKFRIYHPTQGKTNCFIRNPIIFCMSIVSQPGFCKIKNTVIPA